MTIISLSCLDCFPCFCIFSLNLTKFILLNLRKPKRLVFFYKQETGGRCEEVFPRKAQYGTEFRNGGELQMCNLGLGATLHWKKKEKDNFLLLAPLNMSHIFHHQEKEPVLHSWGWVGTPVMYLTVRSLSWLRVAVSSSLLHSAVAETVTLASGFSLAWATVLPSTHLMLSLWHSPSFFFLCLK